MDILFEILKKKIPALGLTELDNLYQMVMHDVHPAFTKGIYIFIETEDNWASSFRVASNLIKKDAATEVFSVYHKKFKGSPGYEKWKDKLERYVGFGRVRYVEFENPRGVNTMSESKALVKFAYQTNRNSFYLVAPPFHMLRAFMTAASVAIRHGSGINFFAYPGAPQDVKQSVTHSQGEGPFPRWRWFELELEKIRKYSDNKDIEPIPGIIEYMKNRKLKF